MRRQVQDDLAKWVPDSAGDPEGQADSRSSAGPTNAMLAVEHRLLRSTARRVSYASSDA